MLNRNLFFLVSHGAAVNLEERGLRWVETSVARRDNHINGSNQPNTSRSSNLYKSKVSAVVGMK